MPPLSVFVHILLYNSALPALRRCLDSLLAQEPFSDGATLTLCVADNASHNDSFEQISSEFQGRASFYRNTQNLGFCAGHNKGAAIFLKSSAEYLLVLNPDVALAPNALAALAHSLARDEGVGAATPKLLRADDNLVPLVPAVMDAAGMYMTPSLRHFDRGSEQSPAATFEGDCAVFGGTGACLLLKRAFVEDVSLQGERYERESELVYPQLAYERESRCALFDEAFFAYREDADLAWRGQYLGWKCCYVATALAYHKRVVTSERRSQLPAILNSLGVRNRFLLQLNNYRFCGWESFVKGILLRNLVVVLAVLLWEHPSIAAFGELWRLRRRALERRAILKRRARVSVQEIGRWFRGNVTARP